MGSLLVITGPPGAGKSTVAAVLAARLNRSALIAGDTFFGFLRNDAVDPWLPAAHAQNTAVTYAAGAAAGHFTRGGLNTVYEGVIGPWFLDEFLLATGLESLDYVMLVPPVETCLERVRTRHNHGFNDEGATRHMHNQFSQVQYRGRHVIRASQATVDTVADHIVEARERGYLAYPDPDDS